MAALARLLEAAPRYAALLRSQYWSRERLRAYAEERIERTLRAAAAISFYADKWGASPRLGDFAQLPILHRSEIGALNSAVRNLHPGERLVCSRSSGSTGFPAEFVFDRRHQIVRHACRARYLRANGWNPLARSAWFISPRDFGPVAENESPDRIFAGSRIFAGARFFGLPTHFDEQAALLAKLDPGSIFLYPSILDGLLRSVERTRRTFPSLRRIFTASEVLDDSLRERARQLLGAEIADNYGSTECFVAWECPRGSYHINAEHVHVEILDAANRPCPPGQMGRVIVTTLENYLMPLVRYDIGDYAVASDGECACGRTLPLIGNIMGRAMNLFRRADGSRFSPWALTGPLRICSEIDQFQVVQKAVDQVLIRYVASCPLRIETTAKIESQIVGLLSGSASVTFERAPQIARTANGKFMLALSEL